MIQPNQPDSHQSQPWAIACFLPYQFPDTFDLPSNQQSNANALAVNRLVVVSDILSINVSNSKSGLANTAEIELSSGNTNYGSALSAGDHAFIWLHNDQSQYDPISKSVYALSQSNGQNSGLKFMGKVHSVREVLTTGFTGIKTLRYVVTLKGFTEFESQIYFNPLLSAADEDALKLYAKISDQWNSVLSQFAKVGSIPVGTILEFFVDVFFGLGPARAGKFGTITRSPNDAFLIPKPVGALLGVTASSKNDLSYSDVLDTIIGVQKYHQDSFIPDLTGDTADANQKDCKIPLYGNMISLPDNFNNVTIWSLLDAHKNSTLNEMFITMRLDQFDNIVPTLVVRQQPFTSANFTGAINATQFLELPRWVLDDRMVMGQYNIGTSNATRCNFLQVYGQMYGQRTDAQGSQRQQIVDGNFKLNRADVVRSGSRNFILTSNADVQTQGGQSVSSISAWANLLADWYMNMHLKLNGSITMPGIADPIAVGDNLEYQGIVFHIEAVQHSYNCSERGEKTFTTTLSLSNGVLTNGAYAYTRNIKRSGLSNQSPPGYSDEERYISDKIIVSNVDGSKQGGQ